MHAEQRLSSETLFEFLPSPVDAEEGKRLLEELIKQVCWQEDYFVAFHRRFPIPRLQAWFADDGIQYSYSNNLLTTQAWLPRLLQLKRQIEQVSRCQFNSVLLTYYRDGQDSVDWHSDDERELGDTPWIASLSLGAERLFQFRPKPTDQGEDRKTIPETSEQQILLSHASLLLMHPEFQRQWQHRVPIQSQLKIPRINLTFRRVISRDV